MMVRNNKAIIFNCSYNGLSIIQELSRYGIECIAMDCVRGIGTFSRYADYVKCPDPRYEEEGFIARLYDYCSGLDNKPVLFPTNDEWALAVSKYKKRLSDVAFVCSGSYDSVGLMLSKDEFYRVGKKKNFMTPNTWERDELQKIKDDVFPIVAKAKYKSVPDDGTKTVNDFLQKNRLILLKNIEDLQNYVTVNSEYLEHLVFQEYVRGMSDSMYTVGIYADENHKVKALFTGRKVRGYPADIGDNIVGESCVVPNEIMQNTTRIVEELKYSGIAEFEYKKDAVSGEYKLIEINPRSWSWIGITPLAGVNIPLIAYNDLTGNSSIKESPRQKTETVRYVKVYQDLLNCLLRYRFSHPDWVESPGEWYQQIKSTKNVYAELHRKDYLISLVSVFYVAAKIFKQ